jgi:mono/diheme cytochrome c family protein
VRMVCMLAVSVFLPAVALAGGPDLKAAGHGRGLYLQYCASCHGLDGKGAGPAALALKTPTPDLTRLPQKNGAFDAARVLTYVDGRAAVDAHGSRDMPVWGRVLSKSGPRRGEAGAVTQVYALVQYIESIQARETAEGK